MRISRANRRQIEAETLTKAAKIVSAIIPQRPRVDLPLSHHRNVRAWRYSQALCLAYYRLMGKAAELRNGGKW